MFLFAGISSPLNDDYTAFSSPYPIIKLDTLSFQFIGPIVVAAASIWPSNKSPRCKSLARSSVDTCSEELIGCQDH